MSDNNNNYYLLVLLVGFVICCHGKPNKDQQWWTAYGGGDDHSGYRNETLGKVEKLRLKWTATASAGETFTQPIIYNGLVISLVSWHNVLYVIKEESGQVLNKCQLNPKYDFSWPSIGVDGNVLLQGQAGEEAHGTFIMSLDPTTCDTKWVSPPYPYQPTLGSFPYGPVSGRMIGMIYAPSGMLNNEMFAIETASTEKVFSTTLFQTKHAPDSWGLTVLAPNDNRLLFSAGLGNAISNHAMVGEIDPISGFVLWTTQLEHSTNLDKSTWWVPVVAANSVVLAAVTKALSSVSLAAIELNNQHTIIWQSEPFDWKFRSDATPATDGNWAYLTALDAVRRYEVKTGRLDALYGPCRFCAGQPIVTHDHLFVKSFDAVLAFNKDHGAPVAKIDEGADFFAYHDKTLFVSRNFAGTLKAYAIE